MRTSEHLAWKRSSFNVPATAAGAIEFRTLFAMITYFHKGTSSSHFWSVKAQQMTSPHNASAQLRHAKDQSDYTNIPQALFLFAGDDLLLSTWTPPYSTEGLPSVGVIWAP